MGTSSIQERGLNIDPPAHRIFGGERQVLYLYGAHKTRMSTFTTSVQYCITCATQQKKHADWKVISTPIKADTMILYLKSPEGQKLTQTTKNLPKQICEFNKIAGTSLVYKN